MAEKNRPPIRRKVIVRPAPPMLKIAACLLILFSMAALLALLEKLNASIRNNVEPERLAPPPHGHHGHRHPPFRPEFPEE